MTALDARGIEGRRVSPGYMRACSARSPSPAICRSKRSKTVFGDAEWLPLPGLAALLPYLAFTQPALLEHLESGLGISWFVVPSTFVILTGLTVHSLFKLRRAASAPAAPLTAPLASQRRLRLHRALVNSQRIHQRATLTRGA